MNIDDYRSADQYIRAAELEDTAQIDEISSSTDHNKAIILSAAMVSRAILTLAKVLLLMGKIE